MKAKEQLLDFINLIFGVLLIAFAVYFFAMPGNFERFQTFLVSLTPLTVFATTLAIRLRLTAKNIRHEAGLAKEEAFIRLTYWDKMKLEIILTGLPIGMVGWTFAFDNQNLHAVGLAVAVFVINNLVLHSIFEKNPLS